MDVLADFLSKVIVLSTQGAGGVATRKVIKGFALPRHGANLVAITKHMQNGANSRQDAITRVLGLRDFKTHAYTTIGERYISSCSQTDKENIIKNQFKKWYFPNKVNERDSEAKEFSIYPYWIILEFFCELKNKYFIDSITSLDFLIFVTSIKNREDIVNHVEAYKKATSNKKTYKDFLENIPETTSDKFTKGHWNQVFQSGFFEPIKYDSEKDVVYIDEDCNMLQIKYFYEEYYFTNAESSEYLGFLQDNVEDNRVFMRIGKAVDYSSITLEFPYKNILLKGVSGTGKSRLLSKIIKEKIFFNDGSLEDTCVSSLIKDNVLRINIHSASSNADLMHGIGIETDDSSRILYKEKRGLVFRHIMKACYQPKLPFVLILEEIQENSLNELIGDLIYLIEESKRALISHTDIDTSPLSFSELIQFYISDIEDIDYVELPNLIDIAETKKMILPDNLYIFCTSNYRDDKKVIEDNLLRRFHVVEVYPQYNNFESDDIGAFLECLNDAILKTLADDEIHEDRFLIGHANWIDIKEDEDKKFFEALLKFFIEFKEIREIEFDVVKNILEVMNKCDKIKKLEDNENWAYALYYTTFKNVKTDSYKEWVDTLQKKVYGDILELQSKSTK